MEHIAHSYRLHLRSRQFLFSALIAFFLLGLALVANFYAGTYAVEKASSPVTDIILNNIRVYDVDSIFIFGPFVFWALVTLYLLVNLPKVPFTVKSIALFIFIRSIFVTLTHIGPFATVIPLTEENAVHWFTFGGDLFFSAHTGLPFLMALLFWETRWLRYFFLASSLFFGVIVLIGHYHYSIDVFAAFFITYAIADLARFLFRGDFQVFLGESHAHGAQ
jgi:hypothetical protein